MTMATVQFFNNPYHYPDFKESLQALSAQKQMTPKNTSTQGGSLHLSGSWSELSSYNYMKIVRDNVTTWAWVDNVTEAGENGALIDYTTDAFRTYKEAITLGAQFIERTHEPTELFDDLLGSTQQAQNFNSKFLPWGNYRTRTLVVQVRRSASLDLFSNTPVQPTPYNFYFATFDPDNWVNFANGGNAIVSLMEVLRENPQTENIVTMYTLPYMNTSDLVDLSLPVETATGTINVPGFKFIGSMTEDPVKAYLHRSRLVNLELPNRHIFRRNHSYRVVIPDAGILPISDEAIQLGNIKVRQDVDMYSGASNYMITAGASDQIMGQSVRGSSSSSIPILSDPYETYISQNQNALSTALIGDVANIGMGLGGMMMGNPMSAGQIASGVSGMIGRNSSLKDMENTIPSNPPSFLGSALANNYSHGFWLIEQHAHVTNATEVNNQFGFPLGMVDQLTIPDDGYVQTVNCSVVSNGRVPQWAIQEINQRFDNGLRVK